MVTRQRSARSGAHVPNGSRVLHERQVRERKLQWQHSGLHQELAE